MQRLSAFILVLESAVRLVEQVYNHSLAIIIIIIIIVLTGIREATFECNRTFDGNSSPYSYNFISSSIRPFVEPETCGPGDLWYVYTCIEHACTCINYFLHGICGLFTICSNYLFRLK